MLLKAPVRHSPQVRSLEAGPVPFPGSETDRGADVQPEAVSAARSGSESANLRAKGEMQSQLASIPAQQIPLDRCQFVSARKTQKDAKSCSRKIAEMLFSVEVSKY